MEINEASKPNPPEELILVDSRNRALGEAEKWAVHKKGLLHRAFSIFLVDHEGRLLLQRRSAIKYHSAGLWANSCCGHPRPHERTLAAARRRLREELGARVPVVSIDGLDLKPFDFIDIGEILPASGAVPVVIKSLVFPVDTGLGRPRVLR